MGATGVVGRYVAWTSFSHDRRQVAFTQYGDDLDTTLWTTGTQPGAEPRLVLKSPSFVNYWGTQWTPDGQYLITLGVPLNEPPKLIRVRISDGSFTTLKSFEWKAWPDYRPRISPDGRYVAYSVREGNANANNDTKIFILSMDGAREVVATPGAGISDSVIWTPDSARIVFVSNRSGKFDLWSLPVREGRVDGNAVRVKADIGRIVTQALTDSGSLYYTLRDVARDVVDYVTIGSLDGKAPVQEFTGTSPSWSPDGKAIAYKKQVKGDEFAVVRHDVASGMEKVFPTTSGFSGGGQPIWLDNESFFTGMLRTADNHRGPFRFHTTTSQVDQMPQPIGSWAFAPRSQHIYTLIRPAGDSEFDHVIEQKLDGSARRDVFKFAAYEPNAAVNSRVSVSPDEKLFAFIVYGKDRLTYAVAGVDGTGFREIYSDLRSAVGGLGWAPDSSAILFARRRDAVNWDLVRLPVKGGNPEALGFSAPSKIVNFSLSPDGARVAATIRKENNHLWSFDNLLSALR